jgi:flagellar biosynthesis/type III secretory pathway protein FliH
VSTIALLEADGVTALASKRVLSPEEVQSLIGARGLLEGARARREQLIADGERLRDEAVRSGHAQGLQEGAAACAQRLLEYERSHAQAAGQRQREVVELVMLVLERVAPALDAGELVAALARQAVQEARQSRRLLVRVAPSALAAVLREIEALRPHCNWLEALRAEADDTLAGDDCVLESPHGFVNAGWATQRAAIRALFEAQPPSPP